MILKKLFRLDSYSETTRHHHHSHGAGERTGSTTKRPCFCVQIARCAQEQAPDQGESGVGQGPHGLPLSSVLLIVLFIVCLCWLMVQCYVRREERLPQAQAGHTVNPSTQPYWLTKVQPQHADTHSYTQKRTVSTHFLQTVRLPSDAYSLFRT